jgi:hypothetical protein
MSYTDSLESEWRVSKIKNPTVNGCHDSDEAAYAWCFSSRQDGRRNGFSSRGAKCYRALNQGGVAATFRLE